MYRLVCLQKSESHPLNLLYLLNGTGSDVLFRFRAVSVGSDGDALVQTEHTGIVSANSEIEALPEQTVQPKKVQDIDD